MQGMIALYLNRTGEGKTAKDILASLKENATISAELGMYWKSVSYGYYWQEAPVETQSLLIETFQGTTWRTKGYRPDEILAAPAETYPALANHKSNCGCLLCPAAEW